MDYNINQHGITKVRNSVTPYRTMQNFTLV
jgi:hypothetical protein